MQNISRKRVSRRQLLGGAGLVGVSAIVLAACGETQIVEKIVTQTEIKEVPVEKIVTQTVEVEKIVTVQTEVEKVVEKVVTVEVIKEVPGMRPPATIRMATKFVSGPRLTWTEWIKANFELQNPWAYVQLEATPGDDPLWNKLATQFAAGTEPDVVGEFIFIMSTWMPRGVFYPLDEFLPKYDVNWDDYYPVDPFGKGWKNATYTMPSFDVVLSLGANMDMMAAKGIEIPTEPYSWEDFREMTMQGTGEEGGTKTWGFGLTFFNMLEQFGHWVRDNGGMQVSEDRTQTLFNMPETLEATQFVSDLYLKDKVIPASGDLDALKGAGIDPWYGGNLLMNPGAFSSKAAWTANAKFAWDFLPYPTKGEGMPIWEHKQYFAMGRNTRDRDATFQLINFICGDPGQEQVGVQGIGLPSMRKWAEDPAAFISQPPEHMPRILDDLERSTHSPAGFPGYLEWRRAVEAPRQRMIAGEITVEDAMNEATTVGQQIMDTAWAEALAV